MKFHGKSNEAIGVMVIGLFGILIQALIGSLIGAVFLRAACALFNKLFPNADANADADAGTGQEPPPVTTVASPIVTPPQIEDDNPYRAPAATFYIAPRIQTGLAVPAYPKAVGIMLVTTLATVLALVATIALGSLAVKRFSILMGGEMGAGMITLQWVVINAVVLRFMLPTKTFVRSLMLSVFSLLIAILTGLAIVAVVALMMVGFSAIGRG